MSKKLTEEKQAELKLLDEFAKAAIPAVIAAGNQTKTSDGKSNPFNTEELFHGKKPWECAGKYAHVAYGIAVSMLHVRKQMVADEVNGSETSGGSMGGHAIKLN